jgi:hypothetical protein
VLFVQKIFSASIYVKTFFTQEKICQIENSSFREADGRIFLVLPSFPRLRYPATLPCFRATHKNGAFPAFDEVIYHRFSEVKRG